MLWIFSNKLKSCVSKRKIPETLTKNQMASPVTCTIDDKDLDDATLWAVIDSAAASLSVSKPRKPLALKYSNSRCPITPTSNFSSPPAPPQKHRFHGGSPSPCSDHARPRKISRTIASDVSDCTSVSPLPVVRAAPYMSPEAYMSPQIGKVTNGSSDCRDGEVKDVISHCLNGTFPSVSLFKEFQSAAMAILEKSDYAMISGNPYIKKSGWRKISFYFNISYEIRDKTIEFDENRNVQRAEFIVRAHMQGGRFSDGWGSCERREKRFLKPNHDIPSTAETRAKNKACQDLIGIGEYRPGATQFPQKM